MLKRIVSPSRAGLRKTLRLAATIAASALTLAVLIRPTEDAVANGDTRSLSLVHMHTGETLDITFKRDGRYDSQALQKLNWFLRDWRREEPTRMDPRLFDTIWLAYRDVGASQPVHVVCGYRAPETNAMLRRRSRGVAKFSQHTLGKAMDFYIPGVDLSRLRVAGLRLQRGGVGFYPTSGSPFVHMDAGSVRMWPKMTRAQLASVFPDGRTVHIPSDGKPMPGYQLAFAEVMRNGGSVGGFQGSGDDDAGGSDVGSGSGSGGGLLAALFGGSGSSSPSAASGGTSPSAMVMADARRRTETPAPAAAPPRQPAPQPVPQPAPVVLAAADPVPAPRAAPVPLPEPRPAGIDAPAALAQPAPFAKPPLAGPQLAWQAGPAGLPVDAQAEASAAAVAINIPLPPSRPAEAQTAPAPAPVQMAALDPPLPPVAPSAAVLATAALPAPTPLPPAAPPTLRALAPVLASTAGGFGSPLRGKSQDRALGYASQQAPLNLLPHSERPALVATRYEKLDFAAVAAPIASAHDPAQAGLVAPNMRSLASLIPAPTKMVVMKFGVTAYGDLHVGRFAGAAIRPLRTASFALAPDIITGGIVAN